MFIGPFFNFGTVVCPLSQCNPESSLTVCSLSGCHPALSSLLVYVCQFLAKEQVFILECSGYDWLTVVLLMRASMPFAGQKSIAKSRNEITFDKAVFANGPCNGWLLSVD